MEFGSNFANNYGGLRPVVYTTACTHAHADLCHLKSLTFSFLGRNYVVHESRDIGRPWTRWTEAGRGL